MIRLIFYFDQSKDPSFHSWISPISRIKRNISIAVIAAGVFIIVGRSGIGSSNTISTSNTMKIIANRKNRIENGIRAVFFGSNPHSNADDFSRSLFVRMFRISDNENVNTAIADAMVANVSGRIIIRKL